MTEFTDACCPAEDTLPCRLVKRRDKAGKDVAFLRSACGQAGPDSALLREYLWACADELGSRLRSDRAIVQAAEYARAWGAPASPGAWNPQRAPGQATASLTMSCWPSSP